jgi:hypothetical protein
MDIEVGMASDEGWNNIGLTRNFHAQQIIFLLKSLKHSKG